MNEILVKNIVPIAIRCLLIKKGTLHTFQDCRFTNIKPNLRLRILNFHLKLVIFIQNVKDIYIRLFCCHFTLKTLNASSWNKWGWVLKISHSVFTIWKSVTQIVICWFIYTLRKWEGVLNHENIYQNKQKLSTMVQEQKFQVI